MSPYSLVAVKIILSIPIGYGLIYPLLHPAQSGGMLAEMQALGPIGSVVVATLFLLLVFAYARDLRQTLLRVHPDSRQAKPNSVWLMFLLPYNFIEDFFIVASVSLSIRAEARRDPRLNQLKSFGLLSGLGWCAAQIFSLIPFAFGTIAGLIALILWIWHWIFIRRVNSILLGQ